MLYANKLLLLLSIFSFSLNKREELLPCTTISELFLDLIILETMKEDVFLFSIFIVFSSLLLTFSRIKNVESSSNLISFLDFAWNKNKTLVRNFELLKATLFMRGFNIAFNAVLIEFLILINKENIDVDYK